MFAFATPSDTGHLALVRDHLGINSLFFSTHVV